MLDPESAILNPVFVRFDLVPFEILSVFDVTTVSLPMLPEGGIA